MLEEQEARGHGRRAGQRLGRRQIRTPHSRSGSSPTTQMI
jgi:hypothetical protein